MGSVEQSSPAPDAIGGTLRSGDAGACTIGLATGAQTRRCGLGCTAEGDSLLPARTSMTPFAARAKAARWRSDLLPAARVSRHNRVLGRKTNVPLSPAERGRGPG